MIFLVSTVKDDAANLRRHVDENLANGIDHVVLCFDAPDDQQQRATALGLTDDPHVTVILCDETWWGGNRPGALSGRQRTNANVVKAMLSVFPWATWLFHLDGDETALLDRDLISAVPAEVSTIKLQPLEAVSTALGERTQSFKRLLGDDELALLHALGLLRRPAQGLYFHGHTSGKSGLRPRLDHWLFVHSTQDADGNKLPQFRHERLRHLHYESTSPQEFSRKWVNLLTAGSRPAFRGNRQSIASAVSAVLALPLSDETRTSVLHELFLRTVADPVDDLERLSLLEHVDPRRGQHRAQQLSEEQLRSWCRLVENVLPLPKVPFARQQGLQRATRLIGDAARGLSR